MFVNRTTIIFLAMELSYAPQDMLTIHRLSYTIKHTLKCFIRISGIPIYSMFQAPLQLHENI